MSHIIGLTSLRPNEVDLVYVQTAELNVQTILALERGMRSAVRLNKRAEWPEILKSLENDGFSCLMHPKQNPVFVHARPWDEHLTHPDQAQSFFVTFPEDAPYEIANQFLLASRNPTIYSMVHSDFLSENKVIVINKDHELIYPDDEAWTDDSHSEKKPIGYIEPIRDQFCSEVDYANALTILAESGYEVRIHELV